MLLLHIIQERAVPHNLKELKLPTPFNLPYPKGIRFDSYKHSFVHRLGSNGLLVCSRIRGYDDAHHYCTYRTFETNQRHENRIEGFTNIVDFAPVKGSILNWLQVLVLLKLLLKRNDPEKQH
jgi:hypothetical protein